ncbi:MAG: TetR/AcrR family transcriptional regulator [Gammaproteobacteria bacterium]|nr:TetR/AcrR family transcriptional regulator [Gammaproteobacteria bacterium]MBL7000948.1 TetR/AcrR family transcriptional regulator [Gammaproteobacteria bacterium]
MPELNESEVYWWRPLDAAVATDTRSKILFAAYKEIHLHGFQSASLNNILAHTGVSKGALYHYFPNKTELGYAVIEEVIADRIFRSFIQPLQQADDPVQSLIELIQQAGRSFTLKDIQMGCPLGSLAQEMAPISEGFRLRLNKIYQLWHGAIIEALSRAQQQGRLIPQVVPEQLAVMVVATLEGCLSAGMIAQDLTRLTQCGAGLIQYLQLISIDKK